MGDMIILTIGKIIEKNAREYPDRIAVKYTDRDFKLTWKELDEISERVAKGFMAIGVQKGDHVAIWATNIPEWILTLFATAKIGAVLVTVNTSYKMFELEYLLRQSDSKVLVMNQGFKDSNYVEILNELCPDIVNSQPNKINNTNLPYLKSVIFAGDNCPSYFQNFAGLEKLGESISDEQFKSVYESLDCHDIINMQYTSGTTGFPKGVMLTHYNIVNNGNCIGDCMKFTPDDKLCITVPLFHCFGMVLAVMASITHATTMIPIDFYSPLKCMQAIQDEECTAFHGVPTMFIGMLDHPEFKNFKFTKLRTGIMAGSPCPTTVMQQVIDEMGAKEITIVFGQTESSPGCTQTTTDDSVERRVNTVGKALPGVECKIVNPETGEDVGIGVHGEFCARGYNIMRGYYKMEEATKQAIDKDGWLHTGDLAVCDEDGYYKITGRIKDMIIRGGENIYPKEIEEFIYTHPAVKDVQVIGIPSVRYGEEILAAIVLKEGMSVTEDEIKDYVRKNMARHKIPSYVDFVDGFPMTASGKIQKYKMREQAIEKHSLKDAANIVTA